MNQDDETENVGPGAASWESVAAWWVEQSARSTVGVRVVLEWAGSLRPGAVVLDVGCGAGSPRSEILARRGLRVYGIDASPTLVAAYAKKIPEAEVACEPVEDSRFFGISFDAVLAWGLLFLLPLDEQRRLLGRLVAVLNPGGTLLFTAPSQECTWKDTTTGRPSTSMGAEAYKELLAALGAPVAAEYDDEGENHYYSARKSPGRNPLGRSNQSLHPTAFGGG